MTSVARLGREDHAVRHWVAEVSAAEALVERRWTRAALKRVDADLARRVDEQRALFDRHCITGSAEDVETHGAAMCRGYRAALSALEASQTPDDAYLLGQCPRTGFRVAVGNLKASAERVSEVHGQAVVWVGVDEVASLLAGMEDFKHIALIKRMHPGAEVIDIRPGEPAKADSGVAA